METNKQLEDRVHFYAREARAIRAAMGDGPRDHQRRELDAVLAKHERAEEELGIRAAARETVEQARFRQRFDFENLLRTGIRAATSAVVPNQGGYSVPALVVGEIVDVLKGWGWMRQVASQITTTSGAPGNVPTSDGSTEVGERLVENTTSTTSDPTFGTAPVPTTKYGSKVITAPIELLQDSAVDIVSWLAQRCVDRIGRIQNTDFTLGTGTNQPTGLITAATVGKIGVAGQTTTIIYDDLADLSESVDAANLGQPSKQPGVPALSSVGWMMSQSARRVVRRIKDTNGMPVWMPGLGGELPQLLDYPVHINNDMAVPAAGAKTIAFGNFSKYVIRDVREMRLYRFDDSMFATRGSVGFLLLARAGGNLTDVNAVKVYQHSAS